MFDRIARVYDRMNSVMTAGMHHRWRERAADLARRAARAIARSTWPPAPATSRSSWSAAPARASVVGMDFSEAMLELARRKAPAIRFEQGNALELGYADDAFDAATVGFGARNFADLARGLAEMARVVRPGGRVVVLEITTPQRPPLSWFFRLWFDRIVPGARQARGRSRRLQLPAQLGAPLPGAARARRGDGGGRPDRRPLGAHRGRDHRHPLRHGPAEPDERRRRSSPRCWRRAARARRAARSAPRCGWPRWPSPRARAGRPRHGDARRRRQAAAAHARVPVRRGRATGLLAAGVAVELLHMATLVHDDVLDQAPLRRGVPTVFATGGREAATATGDLLFSRAFAELAATGSEDAVAALSAASSALARGELMQRADAWSERVTTARYLERCELKTASLFAAACRLGALLGDSPAACREPGGLRPADRPGLPDPRRRARRVGPGRAHRQAPRHRPARRHGHAAADRRPGARPRAGRDGPRELVSEPAQAEEVCDRIAATGALGECRERGADARRGGEGGAGRGWSCRSSGCAPSTWWPTASSSATPEGGLGGAKRAVRGCKRRVRP